MEKTNKVLATIAVAGVIGTAVFAVHDIAETPEVREINVTQNVTEYVNVTKEIIVEVPYNVTVVEEVLVEDEAFKQRACEALLFEDVAECVEEVDAEFDALELAVAEIVKEFAEELDDEDVVRKDSDVRIIEIKADYEDVEVVKSSFDNDKYVFEVRVKWEDERSEEKETSTVKVRVEDSEAEILSIN